MRIAELKQKEVINCKDCERLGFVGDVDFDIETGRMIAIVVPGPCKIWGIIGRDHEYVIPFDYIKQIGMDIILVDINPEEFLRKCAGL
ncbi:MAG: YlmC/YmxH family sporulation protein [Lachnospiraceae bacterium]|nr:YlmC/YmxH family sporulation protein [Lachnospiraceae bacterium]